MVAELEGLGPDRDDQDLLHVKKVQVFITFNCYQLEHVYDGIHNISQSLMI
jgi:hypothetical protein